MRLRKAQFVWPPQQHNKCKTTLTFGCVIYTSLMLTIYVNAGTVCWSRSAGTVCDVNQIPQIVTMPLLPRGYITELCWFKCACAQCLLTGS